MTQTAIDSATTTEARTDPGSDSETAARIEAVRQILAATWAQAGTGPEPDHIGEIATALVDDDTVPPLPTPEAAHHLLAGAQTAARDAHRRALAEQTAAEESLRTFRADVRRRAAQAVNDRHICLVGTNAALREFGADELRVEYRVDLLVPVSTYVRASDCDEAYERAEDVVRGSLCGDGLDIDMNDVRHYDAAVTDEDVDVDPDD